MVTTTSALNHTNERDRNDDGVQAGTSHTTATATAMISHQRMQLMDIDFVRVMSCGCTYDDMHGEQVSCCDACLIAKRVKTVRIMLHRRNAITTNARKMLAARLRYAQIEAGRLAPTVTRWTDDELVIAYRSL